MDSIHTWTRGRTPERISYTPPYLSSTGLFDHIPYDVEALDTYRNHWPRGRTPERVPYTLPGIHHSPAGSRASSTHSARSMIDVHMERAHQERVRSACRGPLPPESLFREESPYHAEYTGNPAASLHQVDGPSIPDSRQQSFSYDPGSQCCSDSTKIGRKRRASPPPLHGEPFPTKSTTDSHYHNRSRYYHSSDCVSPDLRSQSGLPSLSSALSYTAQCDYLTVSSNPHRNDSRSPQNSLSSMKRLYSCECCAMPRRFGTQDGLRRHESKKPYRCPCCPWRFRRKRQLFSHLSASHSRRCSWSCHSRTGPETAFYRSIADQDADLCGYCGQQFANPPNWVVRANHLDLTHRVNTYRTARKWYVKEHFRRHMERSHACMNGPWTDLLLETCMKELTPGRRAGGTKVSETSETSFVPTATTSERLVSAEKVLKKADADLIDTCTKPLLSQNLTTQARPASSPASTVPRPSQESVLPQPAEAFVCSICQRSFTRRATPENHQRSHTGEKPFECGVSGCSQRFSQKGDRARHEQAQHGEKTFVCGAENSEGASWGCGKAFSRKDGLLEYQRKTAKGRKCLVEREKFLEIDERT